METVLPPSRFIGKQNPASWFYHHHKATKYTAFKFREKGRGLNSKVIFWHQYASGFKMFRNIFDILKKKLWQEHTFTCAEMNFSLISLAGFWHNIRFYWSKLDGQRIHVKQEHHLIRDGQTTPLLGLWTTKSSVLVLSSSHLLNTRQPNIQLSSFMNKRTDFTQSNTSGVPVHANTYIFFLRRQLAFFVDNNGCSCAYPKFHKRSRLFLE